MSRLGRETRMKIGDALLGAGARYADKQLNLGLKGAALAAEMDLGMLIENPIEGTLLGWSIEWARGGYPQVTMSHLLAASLMGTSMAPDLIADHLVIPWPAFAILVPNQLVMADSPMGGVEYIDCVHALIENGHVIIIASGELDSLWSSSRRPLSSLGDALEGDSLCEPLNELDQRMLAMLDRLFIGTCVELSSRTNAPAIAKAAQLRRTTPPGHPKVWNYSLRREVVVDVREAITAYVRDGARSPTLRSFVRGHYRLQHYGPGNEFSEVREIAAYWRGPDGAPVAIRPHRLA